MSNVIMMDGFDHYNDNWNNVQSGVNSVWIGDPGLSNYDCINGPGVFGDGQYLTLNTTNSSNFYRLDRYPPTGVSEFACGIRMYCGARSAPSPTSFYGSHVSFGRTGGSDRAVALEFISDGTMRVRINGSAGTYTDVAGAFPGFSQWFYVEVEVKWHASTGYVKIYINSALVYTFTGNTGAGNLSRLTFNYPDTVCFFSTSIDDFYLVDAGARIGEMRVQTLVPTADTADKDWTPKTGTDNYAMVDETTPDGDTTYVETDGVGDIDLYEFGDLVEDPFKIVAVQVTMNARKTDAGDRTIKPVVKSGATQIEGSTMYLSPSYRTSQYIMNKDPDGTIDWSFSSINGLEVGVKLEA